MAKRICFTCMKEYSYCPRCGEDANKPYWMFTFHDANCRKIFDTMQRHYQKEYSDEEAIKILDSCDLSKLQDFEPSIRKQIQSLLDKRKPAQPKKIVNKKKKTHRGCIHYWMYPLFFYIEEEKDCKLKAKLQESNTILIMCITLLIFHRLLSILNMELDKMNS